MEKTNDNYSYLRKLLKSFENSRELRVFAAKCRRVHVSCSRRGVRLLAAASPRGAGDTRALPETPEHPTPTRPPPPRPAERSLPCTGMQFHQVL